MVSFQVSARPYMFSSSRLLRSSTCGGSSPIGGGCKGGVAGVAASGASSCKGGVVVAGVAASGASCCKGGVVVAGVVASGSSSLLDGGCESGVPVAGEAAHSGSSPISWVCESSGGELRVAAHVAGAPVIASFTCGPISGEE